MAVVSLILNMAGGLAMFLFGMKVMSEGLQQSAGDRMRKALNFMTGNRFAGVITGVVVTGIVQSSTAVSVIIVSFVNTGLLTLTQSIGVIFGANIGTTITAWIVSLLGFSLSISSLALPAIGIGFILNIFDWKYKSLGGFILGFGFLFLGLHFLTIGMRDIQAVINFDAISMFRGMGYFAILIGAGTGMVLAILVNSSSATTAIIMTMAFNDLITYEMAAGMILGANLGTTFSAPLVSIAGNTQSKRAALVHVLFNGIGSLWALPLLFPLLNVVSFILPGDPWAGISGNTAIPIHLAGLHTMYNTINAILFLPFVDQFARLVTFIIREKPEEKSQHYRFVYLSAVNTSTPELNILRAEKEIRDMAGVVSSMYARFSAFLQDLLETSDKENAAAQFCDEMKQKETYVDEMREVLTGFLIECTRKRLSSHTEHRISSLLRVIGDTEEMSDECYGISCLLERSVRKKRIFNKDEMDELVPYVNQVEEVLGIVQDQLGKNLTFKSTILTKKLETDISKSRKKLQKLSRKRIEAGKDVQTELLFIDLVRRIEKLGDYCVNIAEKISI